MNVKYILEILSKDTGDVVSDWDVRTDDINEALLDFISIDNRAHLSVYEHDLLLGVLQGLKGDEKIDFCNLIMGDYQIVSIRRITDETIYPKE